MACYSFPVGLFYSLFHAGLSRRTRRSSAAEFVLFGAAAHDRFGDRGRQRRRDLYFDRLRGLAVEDLADELLARFGVFRGAGLGFDGRPLFRRDLLDSQSVLLEVVAQPFLHRLQGGVVEHEEHVFGRGGYHDVVDVRGFADARRTQRGFELLGARLDFLPLVEIALRHIGRLDEGLFVLGRELFAQAVEEGSEARGAPARVVREHAYGLLKPGQPMQVQFGQQGGREQREQTRFGQAFEDLSGTVFGADALKFVAQGARRDVLFHLRFTRVGDLHPRAIFYGVAHADAVAHQTQQARGVVVEAVGADRAQLLALDRSEERRVGWEG